MKETNADIVQFGAIYEWKDGNRSEPYGEIMKGVLTKDNCTAEMQNVLFEYAMKGQSLNAAILKILNVSAFSGVDIMGKWSALPDSSKRLAALWMKLYPDNTYLCHCFAQCKNIKFLAEFLSASF